ncbi:MAG: CPBP family intramembrane metalloprotease [Clostridia bacterium]|nr:CPBP family intramembrane metalloprotease [Clostridia bacterium]
MMEQGFHPHFFLPPEQDPIVRRRERKNFSRIFISLCLYILLATFLQNALTYGAATFFPAFYKSEAFLWVSYIVPSYLIAMPLIWLMLSAVPKKVPEKKRLSPREAILFFSISYAFVYMGQLISNYLSKVLKLVKGNEIHEPLQQYMENFSPLMILVVMVILAPIFEELLFRKLIIDRLLPYSKRLAMVVSGLVFGIIHGNFQQFFYAFFVGIIFGYVYIKTGRLIYTILMHMIINFNGSFVVDSFRSLINSESALSNSINPWQLLSSLYNSGMFILVVAGMILFILNIKSFRMKENEEQGLPLKTQFELAFSNTGMILLLILTGFTFITNIII